MDYRLYFPAGLRDFAGGSNHFGGSLRLFIRCGMDDGEWSCVIDGIANVRDIGKAHCQVQFLSKHSPSTSQFDYCIANLYGIDLRQYTR